MENHNPPTGGPSARELSTTLVVFVVTTAMIAIPYWTAGYDSIREDGVFGYAAIITVVLGAGTFLAGTVSEVSLGLLMVCMLTSAPIAVMGRVLIDTASRPTSHDLWPLEVGLAWMVGLPAVTIGAFIAGVVRRLSPSR